MTRRQAPPPEPIPARVELVSGTRQVIVESGNPLDVVLAAAERMWPLTDTGAAGAFEPIGFSSMAGAASEPVGWPLMGAEMEVPYRMNPAGDVDERRQARP